MSGRSVMVETLYALAKQATISYTTPSNCLDVWDLSGCLPNCKEVEAAAKEAALANFHEIAPCESFLQIQPCQLQELLADPRLASSDEEFVYGAVMRWLGAQTPMPEFADVAELMALIRYPMMRPDFVKEHVLTRSSRVTAHESFCWIRIRPLAV